MSGEVAAAGAQALALYGQGRVAEALTLAWQTASAHPDSPLAHYTYASLLRECGRDGEALAVVDAALRLSPVFPDALVLRGDLRRALSGAQAAEADYLQALRLQPEHALAVHNLAVSRLRMGTITKAVRGLLEAGRLDPGLAELALGNITLALTRVLRWATASVVLLAAALIAVGAMYDEGLPSLLPRVLAVMLTLPLITAIVWTFRTVPAPALRVVLGKQLLLGVRLAFLAVAVIAGLVTAVGAPSLAGVTGPLLLIAIVGLTVLGWMTGA
ncbi:tetratricopeptide repeat protein [Mycolicibacterium frederiksbergense]|uniref:tetratricopeptide repeat protein n=1 Tax=Mycolicibacterium frederiksbergense TaxID=117567 RepID=UPI00399BCF3C